MPASTRDKRKITVSGRVFLWWVAPPDDYQLVYALHVMSLDKRDHATILMVDHETYQRDGGQWFEVRPGLRRQVLCPPSPVPERITPSYVRRVIESFDATDGRPATTDPCR